MTRLHAFQELGFPSLILSLLHKLPNILILCVIVGVLTALALIAPHARARLTRVKPSEEREDAAFDAFKAVTAMIGVVLAFSLVQANANLSAIEALVGKEAAAFSAADRALARLERPEADALRDRLAVFGAAIVEQEWPALAQGERSERVDALFAGVSFHLRDLKLEDARAQSLYADVLKQIDDLAELREQVIDASETSLPSFFWLATLGLLALALLLAGMTSTRVKQSVGVGAGAAAVALLLSFVCIVDRPFEGETSVGSKSISNALERNARRSAVGAD